MPKTTYSVLYWMKVTDSNLLQVFANELKCSIIVDGVIHGEFSNQMLYFLFTDNIPETLSLIFSTMCSCKSTQPKQSSSKLVALINPMSYCSKVCSMVGCRP